MGEYGARVARCGDVVITCLPSPQASAEALEGEGGVLTGLSAGKIWLEMSSGDIPLVAAGERAHPAMTIDKMDARHRP